MLCPICHGDGSYYRAVDGIAFFRCSACESLFADPDFLAAVERGAVENYRDSYWTEELSAARERAFGAAIVRVAEVMCLSRIPVRRFLDIGTGPGHLLDSLATLLPNSAGLFHGVELFPPPTAYCSAHPNYHTGALGDLSGHFDAGLCMEVIEHLTPGMLADMACQLAIRSSPGALYFFNSAQPSFVESVDPGYLDPKKRGHIVSWSIQGVREVFAPAGFNVIGLPGRDWAFLAEYGPPSQRSADDLLSWLWQPVPENQALLRQDAFGPLFATIGIESARCYLEHGLVKERTNWALALDQELRSVRETRL